MWAKSHEYGLHPEDIEAIIKDSANPDLIKLGLALRTQNLSSEGQDRIASRAVNLLTGGGEGACDSLTESVYAGYLGGIMETEETIKAYLLEFFKRPRRLSLAPEDTEKIDRVLDTWIQATRRAVLEKAGLPFPAVDLRLEREDKIILLNEGFTVAFRQAEADGAKALAANQLISEGPVFRPMAARLFRMAQGKLGDDYRLGAAQAAVGEVKHQLLRQERLFTCLKSL